MASNTENLNLLMKNPSTDGADTFNVQTMLNENWQKIDNNAGTVAQTLANILKPTTPPLIGLPPSTTPDGMFQALGNTGELHVWRKTVVTSQEIPAGYKLGSVQTGAFTLVSSNYITYEYGTPTISDDGTVGLSVVGTMNVNYQSNLNDLKGKFCRTTASGGTSFPDGQVIFIPGDAVFSTVGVTKETNKYQPVTGYAKVPAGTTTTYPVSTNPNAYQEGSDAKPAGYTLGEVETGKFVLGTGVGSSKQNMFYISSSITVDDSGNISQENQGSTYINGEDNNTMQGQANNVIGKFVVLNSKQSNSDFDVGTIWYIPPDVTIRNSYSTDGEAYDQYNIINYVNKRQRVTGYAAIPAGTTIEYLGKLGDKARVQVVSYVGTGTYGESQKNSLTFNFSPRVLLIAMSGKYNSRIYTGILYPFSECGIYLAAGPGGGISELNCSKSNHEIFWWASDNNQHQLNISGYKYTTVAIG